VERKRAAFLDPREAKSQVHDLMLRWLAVHDTRVVECDDSVNYRYVDGRLVPAETAAEPGTEPH
jgi:hypothetical protein